MAPDEMHLAAVFKLQRAVNNYAECLQLSKRQKQPETDLMAEIEMMRAIDAIYPDFLADIINEQIQELAAEYGINPEGYPVDENDEFYDNPGRVHSDSPSQREY